jgi:hypothetical protein
MVELWASFAAAVLNMMVVVIKDRSQHAAGPLGFSLRHCRW